MNYKYPYPGYSWYALRRMPPAEAFKRYLRCREWRRRSPFRFDHVKNGMRRVMWFKGRRYVIQWELPF